MATRVQLRQTGSNRMKHPFCELQTNSSRQVSRDLNKFPFTRNSANRIASSIYSQSTRDTAHRCVQMKSLFSACKAQTNELNCEEMMKYGHDEPRQLRNRRRVTRLMDRRRRGRLVRMRARTGVVFALRIDCKTESGSDRFVLSPWRRST